MRNCLIMAIFIFLTSSLLIAQDIDNKIGGTGENDEFFIRNSNDDRILTVQGDGNVGIGTTEATEKLEVNGNIKISGNFFYNELKDYKLVYRDDFESDANGWSMTTRTTFAGANILGGYGVTAGTSFYKDYDLTGVTHTEVMVRLTYYAIDSWDNEWAYVRAGDFGVWHRTLQFNNPGRQNVGGNGTYTDNTYSAEVKISHSANSLRVLAGATLNEASTNESFGIDNVEVWVR